MIRTQGNSAKRNNIWYDSQARFARVTSENQKVIRFQNFGRITGDVCHAITYLLTQINGGMLSKIPFSESTLSLIKNANDKEKFFSISKEIKENNHMIYIVDYSCKSRLIAQYWIDPGRGYICPKVIEYGSNGNIKSEYVSSDYFLDDKSGYFFPKYYNVRKYDPKTNQVTYEVEYIVADKTSLNLNTPVSNEEFNVDLEKGSIVLDERNNKNIHYMVKKNTNLAYVSGNLTLETNNDLSRLVDNNSDLSSETLEYRY